MTEPLRQMSLQTVQEVGEFIGMDALETNQGGSALGDFLMDEVGVHPESFETFMTAIFKGMRATKMLANWSEVQAASAAFTTMFAAGVLMERKRAEAEVKGE